MIAYFKPSDIVATKWMYFLIKDEELLKNYNYIQNKISNMTKKEFDREPMYNKNLLKTKIKSNSSEATKFYDKETPTAGSNLLLQE